MSIKKILSVICITTLIIFSIFSRSYAESSYIWSNQDGIQLLETNSESNNLNLQSDGAILIDQTTGTVLYEHNSHEMFRPASVTKVMSILLIMEAVDSRSNYSAR